ncbi:MAG: VTT domain-containing protein [Deltaproteobacteria bacterium]|nr:VTT domain-containing protein [Deltaproteobacteria bacterium]
MIDSDKIINYLILLGTDPFAIALAIILATFILEDAATVGAAMLASDGILPIYLAIIALISGIVLGDVGLYGLGRLSTKSPWVRRMLRQRKTIDMRNWMAHRILPMVFAARFIPGARFPYYTASGLLGLPFWRFTMAAFLAVTLWTSLLFTAVIYFGIYFHDRLGWWRWILAGGVVLAIIALSRIYRHALLAPTPSERWMPDSNSKPQKKINQEHGSRDLEPPKIVAGIPGMPPINLSQPPLSFYEFWPPWLFYIPIALTWGVLSLRHFSITLPTVANPLFPDGDLTGESKSKILDLVQPEGKKWFAKHAALIRSKQEGDTAADVARAMVVLSEAGISFPVVTKPDIGCRGVGVRLAKNKKDLAAYVANFPPGQTILFQEYVDYEPEAGIFYIRFPGAPNGFIFSITLKYFPRVIGDGRSTLRELIIRDPRAGQIPHVYFPRHANQLDRVLPPGETFRLNFAGSHSRGTIFRNGNAYITKEISATFDEVAKTIPEFYFGRFDVRFPDFKALQSGEDFKIVEINGAGGEATSIWDSSISLGDAYQTLIRQWALLFRIGALNRARGFRPVGMATLFRNYRLEQKLSRLYPLTE